MIGFEGVLWMLYKSVCLDIWVLGCGWTVGCIVYCRWLRMVG